MNFLKRKFYRFYVDYLKNRSGNDMQYLKVQYYLKNDRKLNLDPPKEFMEKIQWLKLFKYTEAYKDFVDKFEVRKFVKDRVGEEVLNEVYKVYSSPNEIVPDELPDAFVLKCTHASGTNIIVKDKSKADWKSIRSLLKKWMDTNYYQKSRERVYKDIEPRIIAEKYLSQLDHGTIIDYKFYCFHGVPKYVLVKTNENGRDKKAYFTMDWEKVIPERQTDSFLTSEIQKPANFEEMKNIAQKLAADFIFIRVDLYSIDNQVLFGELTFFPTGGIKRLFVERMNRELGDLIHLPI